MAKQKRPVKCGSCKGSGFLDSFKTIRCDVCNGVGKVRI